MKRNSRWAVVALGVATVQVGAILVFRAVDRQRESPKSALSFAHERLTPRPAPDLQWLGLDGSPQRLSAYRGRPLLLHFWATWCPPCKAELPALLALGRDLERDGGPRIIALATDPDWEAIRRFFEGKVPSEVVRDASGDGAASYEVSTLPNTYLVSADGDLLLRFGGARDWSSEAARRLLLATIRTPRAP
ncbi:MAG TPA: TlpA disulfide reductase family protein [Polyangiaceae bacterium]|nr:TlpA disulfide reductase family protein [Polyangiaceae bacterium]